MKCKKRDIVHDIEEQKYEKAKLRTQTQHAEDCKRVQSKLYHPTFQVFKEKIINTQINNKVRTREREEREVNQRLKKEKEQMTYGFIDFHRGRFVL